MADVKNTLYIWSSKNGRKLNYEYEPIGRNGFYCKATIDKIEYTAIGKATNKKDAQAAAAADFLKYLSENNLMIKPCFKPILPATNGNHGVVVVENTTSHQASMPVKCFPTTTLSPEELQKQQKLEEELLNVDAHLHGNWTLNFAKKRLHEYLFINKIKTEYIYTYYGPLKHKSYGAEMKIFIPEKKAVLSANEMGSTKVMASKATALNLIKQLYDLKIVERFQVPPKPNLWQMKAYDIAMEDSIVNGLNNALFLLNAQPTKEKDLYTDKDRNNVADFDDTQREELISLESYRNPTETSANSISWSPPCIDYNPWTNVCIPPLEQLQSAYLAKEWKERFENYPILKKVLDERDSLPIFKYKQDILNIVNNNIVTIIKGIAGTGKSTQVPQYILDYFLEDNKGCDCNILSIQPNRLACLSSFDRVNEERIESFASHNKAGGCVGYALKYDQRLPRSHASILFATSDFVFQRFLVGTCRLDGISHIILDEVQESNKYMEFLLILFRDICKSSNNSKIKLILLLSTTTDVDYVKEYFKGESYCSNNMGFVEIPLKTFPVQRYHLEDCVQMTNFDRGGAISNTLSNIRSKRARLNNKTLDIDEISINENEETVYGNEHPLSELKKEEGDENVIMDHKDERNDIIQTVATTDVGSIIEDTAESIQVEETTSENKNISDDTIESNDPIDPKILEDLERVHILQCNDMSINLNMCVSKMYKPDTRVACTKISEKEICYELIYALLEYIENLQNPGTILIFLPDICEINRFTKYLNDIPKYSSDTYRILHLHDHIALNDIRKLYNPVPVGTNKIVLATNIGESCVTMNDVVYVIDSCKTCLKLYDYECDAEYSSVRFTSKYNLDARFERAGHTRPGFCFHLSTRARFLRLYDYPLPEMHTTALHDIALAVTELNLTPNVGSYFARAIEPVPFTHVRATLVSLLRLRALEIAGLPILASCIVKPIASLEDKEEVDQVEAGHSSTQEPTPAGDESVLFNKEYAYTPLRITALGRFLAKLAIEPKKGKMLMLATVLGVGDTCCVFLALSAFPDVFKFDLKRKHLDTRFRKLYGNRYSDSVAHLIAYQRWEGAKDEGKEIIYCKENKLDHAALIAVSQARNIIKKSLIDFGFDERSLQPNKFDTSSRDSKLDLVIGLLCVGWNPNYAYHHHTHSGRSVQIGPLFSALISRSSTLCSSRVTLPTPFFIYEYLTSSKSIQITNVSIISPLHVLLFGIYDYKIMPDEASLIIDNWIKLNVAHEVFRDILALRQLTDDLLARMCDKPGLLNELLLYTTNSHHDFENKATTAKDHPIIGNKDTSYPFIIRAAIIIDQIYTLCEFDTPRYGLTSIAHTEPPKANSMFQEETFKHDPDVKLNDQTTEADSLNEAATPMDQDDDFARAIDYKYAEHCDSDEVESVLSFQSNESVHIPLTKLIKFQHLAPQKDNHPPQFNPNKNNTFLPTDLDRVVKNVERDGSVDCVTFDLNVYDINTYTDDYIDMSRFATPYGNKFHPNASSAGFSSGRTLRGAPIVFTGPRFSGPPLPFNERRSGGHSNRFRPPHFGRSPLGFGFRAPFNNPLRPASKRRSKSGRAQSLNQRRDGANGEMTFRNGDDSRRKKASKNRNKRKPLMPPTIDVAAVGIGDTSLVCTDISQTVESIKPSGSTISTQQELNVIGPGILPTNKATLTGIDVKGVRTDLLDPKTKELVIKARKRAKRERYLQNKITSGAVKPKVKRNSGGRKVGGNTKHPMALNDLKSYDTLLLGIGSAANPTTPKIGLGSTMILSGNKFTASTPIKTVGGGGLRIRPKLTPPINNLAKLQNTYVTSFKFGEFLGPVANKGPSTGFSKSSTSLPGTGLRAQQQYFTNYGSGCGPANLTGPLNPSDQQTFAMMNALYGNYFGASQIPAPQHNPQQQTQSAYSQFYGTTTAMDPLATNRGSLSASNYNPYQTLAQNQFPHASNPIGPNQGIPGQQQQQSNLNNLYAAYYNSNYNQNSYKYQ